MVAFHWHLKDLQGQEQGKEGCHPCKLQRVYGALDTEIGQ